MISDQLKEVSLFGILALTGRQNWPTWCDSFNPKQLFQAAQGESANSRNLLTWRLHSIIQYASMWSAVPH